MIVRVTFYSTSPDALAKGKEIWDNEMAPLLKKQKGFYRAYRADANDEPGGVVIQLWESKRDEENWRASAAYQGIAGRLGPLFPELRIERDFELAKEL